jgi:hypothetical protein
MRVSLRLAPWLTAFVLGVGGCGGGESDESEAKRTAQAYVDALADGDAGAACEYMRDDPVCVERTQREIDRGQAFGDDFGHVETVIVDGNEGRANFSTGAFLVLSEREDGWKIGAPASRAADLAPDN